MPSKPPKVANASVAERRLSQTFAITEGQEADLDAVILSRDSIDPDPDQPRVFFDEEKLRELGEDLRQHSLQPLQPLIVRPHPRRDGRFMIVAGERRWRAAGQDFGDVERLRCTLRDLSEVHVALIQGAENDKREDTSVIAKGRNYNRIKNAIGLTWKEVGERVTASEQTVLRHVRLLRLPRDVQDFMEKNSLSEKHGRAFLTLQESGNGKSGPDLSSEKPNANHKKLMRNIEDGGARGHVVSGEDSIKLASEYVEKKPQSDKESVEEQATILREKNNATPAATAPAINRRPETEAPDAVAAAGVLPVGDLEMVDAALDETLTVLREWMRGLSVEQENRVTREHFQIVQHIREARKALARLKENK